MKARKSLLGLVVLAAIASAGELVDWRQEQAVMDSLRTVPPRQREFWLRQRGIELPGYTASQTADSGLTLIGKWGRGPSVDVTGQDTLVVLSLGSEVALLSFAQPDSPRVLSEIQLSYMAGQAQLAGNRLYVNSGGSFEVWDIADPTQPVQHGVLPFGIGDFWVNDTFLYFIKADTFKAFSVANPVAMYQLGACRDSGYFLTATASTAVLGHPSHGLYFVDISDPRNPHRAGSYATDLPRSAAARGNLCCATVESRVEPYPIRFLTLNIANPASPGLLGSLNNAGGYDIYLDSSLAFASGRSWPDEPFQIISISDSAHPVLIDSCTTTDRYNWGVWASLRLHRAFVADEWAGLAVVDISNLSNAVLDTWVLATGPSVDVCIDNQRCYVANGYSGMRILDIADPTMPTCLGEFDSVFSGDESNCVAARDSFAFVGRWPQPALRSVLVTDPARPQQVGACPTFNFPEDMVLRDSFLYVAEDNRFQVVNVARPRSPTVVGTCNLPDYSYGMCLRDTLAYVSTYPLAIINVRNPAQPNTIGSILRGTWSVFVKDTLAYLAAVGLHVWNVRNPASPQVVDSLTFGRMVYDVAVVDTLAYMSCSDGIRLASVADPHNMRVLAFQSLPYIGGRLVWDAPYVYVAVRDAGICVFETTQTGISEVERSLGTRAGFSVTPNPVVRWLSLEMQDFAATQATVYDAAGREVLHCRTSGGDVEGRTKLDLGGLSPGLYFVRLDRPGVRATAKVVKQP